jgi:hypothetical protein
MYVSLTGHGGLAGSSPERGGSGRAELTGGPRGGVATAASGECQGVLDEFLHD